MDNLHVRMFDPGKENNIHDHSSKEHFKISKIAKFSWQMLPSRENLGFLSLRISYIQATLWSLALVSHVRIWML